MDILPDCTSNLKCSRSSTSKDSGAITDRISALPDSLLSHILSFLPTKYAVGTSILSTRWKFVWTSITNLDFDNGLFLHHRENKKADRANKMFMRFVYRVLLLLKPLRIRKFHLKCEDICLDDLCVNDWVSGALELGVEELDLDINDIFAEVCLNLLHKLPRTVLNCNTLAVLKLNANLNFCIFEASVSLPSLKILHLLGFAYHYGECVSELVRNCPVLEELIIGESYVCEVTINVSSASLKRLKISIICYHPDAETPSILQINTPALEYLDLKNDSYCFWRVSLENMASLIEANIDVYFWNRPGDEDDGNLAYDDDMVFELLKELSSAKFLSLSRQTMEALSCTSLFSFPKFHNLSRLKVSFESKSREWKPLLSLLANSDNLEELICN